MKTYLTLCSLLGLLTVAGMAAETATIATPVPPDSPNRPGRIIQTVQPQYPAVMIDAAVKEGGAQVLLEVDPSGQLTDVLVTAYTHQPFAEEATRIVRLWKYDPARSDGRPISTLMAVSFKFELNGLLIVSSRETTLGLLRPHTREYEYEARTMKDLDGIPTPVKVVPPAYPQEWASRGLTGPVTVDFYIDESGRVRMASCPPGTEPSLGGLALAAVQEWKFTPPTSNGRPVLVHARQVFNFIAKTTPAGT